jgi:molybdopterin-guanine dinucleotide biosynthesis protein A
MANDITVAILAGGLSRRMGTNKSFVSLAGKPFFEIGET